MKSQDFSMMGKKPSVSYDDYDKLFGIEKKQIKRRSLFQGIFIGLLICLLFFCSFIFMLWVNQDQIAEAALGYLADNYLQDLFASFPDAYVSFNQHKILPILDGFTNAAAAKRVTRSEFKYIGKSIILALKDKKLTYHEVTGILAQMETASKKGYNF